MGKSTDTCRGAAAAAADDATDNTGDGGAAPKGPPGGVIGVSFGGGVSGGCGIRNPPTVPLACIGGFLNFCFGFAFNSVTFRFAGAAAAAAGSGCGTFARATKQDVLSRDSVEEGDKTLRLEITIPKTLQLLEISNSRNSCIGDKRKNIRQPRHTISLNLTSETGDGQL